MKEHFSWGQLLGNARAMKRARGPLRGYVTTQCFWALLEVGMLEPLAAGERVSCEEFAAAQGLDVTILRHIVRYLHRMRYLDLEGDTVAFTAKGRAFWNEAQSVFRLFHAYEPLFSTLEPQLRKLSAFDRDLFRREGEVARGFAELGRNFMFPILRGIIAQQGFRSVVDLGCAEVALSAYLCERDPNLHCLGIDCAPEVVARARQRVERLGMGERIRVLQADIFQLDPGTEDFSGYDVVTAVDLFHGYFLDGETRLLDLFATLRRAFPRQALLVSEICLPSHAAMPRVAYPYVEHELFHDLTRQKSFAPGQLEDLLSRSGFRIDRKWNFNEIAGRLCLLCR